MGSSSSTKAEKQQFKAHNRQNEQKEKDDDKIKKLESLTNEVYASIEGDQTLPNLVHNFSKMLQKPDLFCFKNLVDTMQTNWNNITKCLDGLVLHLEAKETDDMLRLQRDYWLLLLKTRSMIEILVKKCEIQQRHIQMLLKIVGKNGALNANEKLLHSRCVEKLAEWMDVGELNELCDDWRSMSSRLEEQVLSWKEKAEKLGEAAKNTAMSCIKWLGVILSVSAVVVIIIFTAVAVSAASGGAAAGPAAIGGVAAVKATVTFGGATMLTSHAVGIGIGAGLLVLGGATYAGYAYWENNSAAYKAHKNAQKITNMIQEMIKNTKRIEDELNKLKTDKNKTEMEFEYLKDVKLRDFMHQSLEQIDTHLSDYITQGKVVIDTVNKACKVYI